MRLERVKRWIGAHAALAVSLATLAVVVASVVLVFLGAMAAERLGLPVRGEYVLPVVLGMPFVLTAAATAVVAVTLGRAGLKHTRVLGAMKLTPLVALVVVLGIWLVFTIDALIDHFLHGYGSFTPIVEVVIYGTPIMTVPLIVAQAAGWGAGVGVLAVMRRRADAESTQPLEPERPDTVLWVRRPLLSTAVLSAVTGIVWALVYTFVAAAFFLGARTASNWPAMAWSLPLPATLVAIYVGLLTARRRREAQPTAVMTAAAILGGVAFLCGSLAALGICSVTNPVGPPWLRWPAPVQVSGAAGAAVAIASLLGRALGHLARRGQP